MEKNRWNETITIVSYYLQGMILNKSDSKLILTVKEYDQSIWCLRYLLSY